MSLAWLVLLNVATAAPCELRRDGLLLSVQGRDWEEGIVGGAYSLAGARWMGGFSRPTLYATWGVYEPGGGPLPASALAARFGDLDRQARMLKDMRGARTRTWALVATGVGAALTGGFLTSTSTFGGGSYVYFGFGHDPARTAVGLTVAALSVPLFAIAIPQVAVERHREQFPSRYWSAAEMDVAITAWNERCIGAASPTLAAPVTAPVELVPGVQGGTTPE
jgi:hypothetical protein